MSPYLLLEDSLASLLAVCTSVFIEQIHFTIRDHPSQQL